MADAGSFNADLGMNIQFNIDGAGLTEMTKTIKEISKGKDLQRYWKDVESATNNAVAAIKEYKRDVNSQDLATDFLKQINALKAITKKENLSEIFPDMKIDFNQLVESAKKVAPLINSEFSSSKFEQAFNTFDLLKEKGIELEEVFKQLSSYSKIVQENLNLNRENRTFRNLIGDKDIEKIKKDLSEIQHLRKEAEKTFTNFLKVNNIEKTDYWGNERFSDYFSEIRNGTMTATKAITQFKTEYAYLLEESFKANNNTFGLEQLQAFSTTLDSIFRQVEETSLKINDIISNGVIAKSVQNLSTDTALSDSQRSLFGNLLQDEESLKSITTLFQKLIEESNQTKNTEMFNSEQFVKIEELFTNIESHLSSIKSVLVDVGDGEELSPLLNTINNIELAIDKLSSSVKGIGLNMNIGFGSDSEMEAKAQAKISNALQAYQRLFDHIKMSSAGGSVINDKFFNFDINQFDTPMSKLQAYKKFIENMRNEAKQMFNGQDVLYSDTEKKYWTQASSAIGQVTKTFNEMKAASNTNPLENIFGKTDLTEVISQLNTIVNKLDEISISANKFSETFKDGLNITTSVEEITTLTNKVKELETELERVKSISATATTTSSTSTQKTNISSGMKDAFPSTEATASVEKVADGFKEVKQETEKATESAKDYVRTISQVGKWNVDSKVSVVKEKNDGQLETWSYDAKRGKKDITYDKDGNINYGDPIITTISNYKQLEQTIVKADDKLRDLKKTLKDTKEINPNASTENIEKQIEYQEEYISLLEKTVKIISKSNKYFLNEQQIIDARKKAATEYDFKQGTKSDIANAKQSAKANKQAIKQEQKLTDELRKQEEQARKTALSYTESASKKLSNAISKYSYGDSSDATAMMKQMNRGVSNFGDLSNVENKIKRFSTIVDKIILDLKESHTYNLNALNNEIKTENELQAQKDAFNKSNLNAIDLEIKKKETEAKNFSNQLKTQMQNRASSLNSVKKDIENYTKDYRKYSKVSNQNTNYQELISNFKSKIAELRVLFEKLSNEPIITEEQKNNISSLRERIQEVKEQISSITSSDRGSSELSRLKIADRINKFVSENTNISKQANEQAQQYMRILQNGDANVQEKKILEKWIEIEIAERKAGRTGKSYFDIFKEKSMYGFIGQMQSYLSMYVGFYGVINALKKGISIIREFDTAYTEMLKVSNESRNSLKNYQQLTFDVADSVGTTAKQLQDSTADYMRLGESIDSAAESAKIANILLNVSEFDNVEDATKSLIAMGQAYKDLDKIDIVDKLNEVGNNYSISTDELASSLQRSSATLSLMGNTIDEAAALVTTANSTIQDADSVSAGLRTISLRLVGTEEAEKELSAMNEDVDAFVKATNSKKQKIIQDYTAVASNNYQGFNILDNNGNYKNTYDILLGIAKVYKEIQEQDKKLGTNHAIALVEELAGKNRSNVASAILKDPEQLESVKKSSEEADGSAQKELNKYLDSIDGRMTKLSNKAQKFWAEFIDTDLIKNGISLLSQLLDTTTSVVDKFGAMPVIMGVISSKLSFKKNAGGTNYISKSSATGHFSECAGSTVFKI